jgi:hypothetical protein
MLPDTLRFGIVTYAICPALFHREGIRIAKARLQIAGNQSTAITRNFIQQSE